MEGFIHDFKKTSSKSDSLLKVFLKLNDFGNFEPRVKFILKVNENEELNYLQPAIESFIEKIFKY